MTPGTNMDLAETCLNVAAWKALSTANGPGVRAVIWLQGCPLLCPGCVNQDFLPNEARQNVPVSKVVDRVLGLEGIEGITFSGGEPTMQAEGVARVCEQLHLAGLTTVSYTGYTLEALRNRCDPWVNRMLDSLDMLIDGPYVEARAASILWRGSTNQRVHFLTPTYRHLEADIDGAPAQVEISLGDAQFSATGTWPNGFVETLTSVLNTGG